MDGIHRGCGTPSVHSEVYAVFDDSLLTTSSTTVAVLRGDSTVGGTVTFEQSSETSPTTITYDIKGSDASAERGMHIHQFGDNTNGCTSAGPHCEFDAAVRYLINNHSGRILQSKQMMKHPRAYCTTCVYSAAMRFLLTGCLSFLKSTLSRSNTVLLTIPSVTSVTSAISTLMPKETQRALSPTTRSS